MFEDAARKGILQKMINSVQKVSLTNIELAEDFGTQHNL